MTGSEGTSEAPTGPPWSVDLLADLHSGVLETATAARLRPEVESDPDARAVLAALDATRVDLASMPQLRMPDNVAARLDGVLLLESFNALNPGRLTEAGSGPAEAPVTDISKARKRRNRAIGLGGGVLATAAAVIGITMAMVPSVTMRGTPQAVPTTQPRSSATSSSVAPSSTPSGPPPLLLRSDQVASAAPKVIGSTDYGPLRDAQRLDGCLHASGIPTTANPLGVREIQLDGRRAVLVVLPAGLAQYRLVVVGAACGPGKPDKISDTVVGRR